MEENNNVVVNEEVVENNVVEQNNDEWTTSQKVVTGAILGTSAVGTGVIIYEVVKNGKKMFIAVGGGIKRFFGKIAGFFGFGKKKEAQVIQVTPEEAEKILKENPDAVVVEEKAVEEAAK